MNLTDSVLSDFLRALKRLFTNRLWVGNLFNTTVAVLAYSCYWNFKPKYLESQFRKSAAEANFYTGNSGVMMEIWIVRQCCIMVVPLQNELLKF